MKWTLTTKTQTYGVGAEVGPAKDGSPPLRPDDRQSLVAMDEPPGISALEIRFYREMRCFP